MKLALILAAISVAIPTIALVIWFAAVVRVAE